MKRIDLSAYDSSDTKYDIRQSINHARTNTISIEKLSHKINFNNEFLTYDENILYQYRGYLSRFLIKTNCPKKFYYHPELVAKEVYGTIDLWYLIMWFNPIPSAMEFNSPVINIFDPSRIGIINNIINNHSKETRFNAYKPDFVEKNILKPIKIKQNRLL